MSDERTEVWVRIPVRVAASMPGAAGLRSIGIASHSTAYTTAPTSSTPASATTIARMSSTGQPR